MSCPFCDLARVGVLGKKPPSPLTLIAIGLALCQAGGLRAVTEDVCGSHLIVWAEALAAGLLLIGKI